MELQLCQVAFILTTLFGEFDAKAILSRHSEITRPDQSLVSVRPRVYTVYGRELGSVQLS